MDPGLVVFLIIFLLGFLGFAYNRKIAREAKKIGAEVQALGTHLHGLPGLSGKEFVKLFFTNDKIITKVNITKVNKKTYELSYDKITAIAYANKSDILTKDRSVIGRGIAGGILLGPVAAVIGGMSAVGKKKHIKGEFLIINYISSDNEEPKTIIFDLHKGSIAKKAEKFILDKRPKFVEPSHITL